MTAKLQIQTRVRRLIHYIEDIGKGLIQIPAFQRDFIWKTNNKIDLFDSIKRGYPIGSILFWRPESDTFGRNSEIGPYTIPEKDGEYFYILDGFQRLSTLFGCLINPDKTKLSYNKEILKRGFNICYDLDKEEFFIPRSQTIEPYQVHVYDLIDTRSSFVFQRELFNQKFNEDRISIYSDRYEKLGTALIDYALPSIDIFGGEIEEAVEIFSRVNSMGAVISPDWMVSALTYNNDKDFRLGSLIDDLFTDLSIYSFTPEFSIKRELILNCITNSFGRAYFDQSSRIEDLAKRDDFIEITRKTIESIKLAVKFLFEELLVLNGKLLPYGPQLIFITDFFNTVPNPEEEQIVQLKEWFWKTTYSGYFTIYSLSKIREAYNVFQQFLKGEIDDPVYNDRPRIPFPVSEFPNKIYMGSVRAKALVLYLLNYSNNFQKVDSNEVDGLILSYLFHESKDDKGNFFPESVVPMIENEHTRQFKKKKDVSELLDNYSDVNMKYLITDEMALSFHNGYKEEVLRLRKELIITKEKAFVQSLGLKYEY